MKSLQNMKESWNMHNDEIIGGKVKMGSSKPKRNGTPFREKANKPKRRDKRGQWE